MSKIYYLGYYDQDKNKNECRNYVRAATTKMDYIASKIVQLGYDVCILSMSGTKLKHAVQGHNIKISNNIKLELLPSLGSGWFAKRFVSRKILEHLMYKRLCSLSNTDIVIAYHSLGYVNILKRAKKKVNFRLLLEVEEFYSDVTGNKKDAKLENSIFKIADSYLCSTELLVKRLPKKNIPTVICSGIYKMEKLLSPKRNDGFIHIVYAGTLDPRKGGAAAAAAAAYLPSNYRIHILGSGSKEEIDNINNAIAKANSGNGCLATYDGYLSGEKFNSFLQSCHIGLSPQNPDAAFNATSFPSKIFMYFSNSLSVVSVNLPVFDNTPLRNILTISSDNSPNRLAKAVTHVDIQDLSKVEKIIISLDEDFGHKLSEIISKL